MIFLHCLYRRAVLEWVIEIHIQKSTLSCKTGSDSKHDAYMKVISCNFQAIKIPFNNIQPIQIRQLHSSINVKTSLVVTQYILWGRLPWNLGPHESYSFNLRLLFEPHHEKTCFCHRRTTKPQFSLRIRTVWSAPLLFAAEMSRS